MRKIFIFILLMTYIGSSLTAQVSYDIISFEDAVTIPNAKQETDTSNIFLNGKLWKLPGVYLGTPDANDFKINNKSARIGRFNDSPLINGSLVMQEDYLFGFEYFGFVAAMYGNHTGGKLLLSYSTNSGASWIVADTFNIAPNNNPTRYDFHDHIFGRVRFKIEKLDSGNTKINIDSIYCIQMADPGPLAFSVLYPTHRVHPSIDKLSITFNQHIASSGVVGNIYLANRTNNNINTYSLSSPNVELQSDSLIINDVQLQPNTSYYVMFDSTIVESELFGTYSPGIYDTNTWSFFTSPYTLNNINESFDSCDQWDLLGVFKQYSMLDGSRRWNCEMENNNTFISMTGNTPYNKAVANEDWLVSYLKFDFNGKVPVLKFKERKVGSGNQVVRNIKFTTNFTSYVNTTIWGDVQTLVDDFTDNNWRTFTTTLQKSEIINQPINLAIVYSNPEDNNSASGWKWDIDDLEILVDTTTNVAKIENIIPSCYIVYPTFGNKVEMALFSNQQILNNAVQIYDVNGRLVYNDIIDINVGMKQYIFGGLMLNNGIYIININTEYGVVNRKFLVQN